MTNSLSCRPTAYWCVVPVRAWTEAMLLRHQSFQQIKVVLRDPCLVAFLDWTSALRYSNVGAYSIDIEEDPWNCSHAKTGRLSRARFALSRLLFFRVFLGSKIMLWLLSCHFQFDIMDILVSFQDVNDCCGFTAAIRIVRTGQVGSAQCRSSGAGKDVGRGFS